MAEMTVRELTHIAGKARLVKMTPQQRSEVARKGGNATKAKYGLEYFKNLRKKSGEAKKINKK
ncbi:MAG: hypothetical protein PHV63_02700 [Candidatus Daviesbacteria bacterium]|nr:hypothetical protein [Candidatus Daviesbacteria bacterium]